MLRPTLSTARLSGLLVAGALLLNVGVLLLPGGGLDPFAKRLLACGHAEFFVRASLHPELYSTLRSYEELVADGNPAFYASQKGPANQAAHVVVHRLAQSTPLRRRIDASVADTPGFYGAMHEALARSTARRFSGFDERHGLAVTRAFLLMPVVSSLLAALLPLPVLLLGTALFPRDAAVVAAATSAALPPILFEQVQLDGSVFPLLFATGLAAFVAAWSRRSGAGLAAAGALAALYAWFTLAAVVLVAICVATLLVAAVAATLRRPAAAGAHALPSPGSPLRGAAAYGAGLLGGLLLLRVGFAFHVFERYAMARGLQTTVRDANVGAHEAAWRWVLLNGIELAASLGPIIVVLAAFGVVAAAVALVQRRAAAPDTTSLAVVAVLAALLLFGVNSEVYRLWAFLGVALLVPAVHAGREVFALDTLRGRATWWLLVCAWTLAVAARYGHVRA
ncbi:MAG: hypothetical protein QNK04_26690 [Myxococcota bacterium]|nr:hypothetical protein [Myxococcota bacterium]